ncbi:MAG: hypothetical protein WC496_06320 [Phycisphaerae bacterium]|jgi:hypothetical protein
MGKQKNTTINAIIILEKFLDNLELEKAMWERKKKQKIELAIAELLEQRMELQKHYKLQMVLRVVVIENPFARIPLFADIFGGYFDERWQFINGNCKRIFAGDKLKELEALKGKSV